MRHSDTVLKPKMTKKQKQPWSCYLVLYGALWNSRAHSKMHKKTQLSCFLVLYEPRQNIATTEKQQKARKARKAPKAQGGEGTMRQCGTAESNFHEKANGTMVVLFVVLWNSRAHSKLQLIGAICEPCTNIPSTKKHQKARK